MLDNTNNVHLSGTQQYSTNHGRIRADTMELTEGMVHSIKKCIHKELCEERA